MGATESKQKVIFAASSAGGSTHVPHKVFWEEHDNAVSVIVQVAGRDVARYPCQRAILMKYAPKLAKRIDAQRNIKIDSYNPEIVEHVLRYVHQQPVDLDDWETARDVRVMAWEYELWQLGKECEEFLMSSITIGNVCHILDAFLRLGPTFPETFRAIDRVCKDIGFAVLRTKAFTEVSEDTVIAIASTEEMNVKDESSVLEALLRWARAKFIREATPLSEDTIVETVKDVIETCVGFEFMSIAEKEALPVAVQVHCAHRLTRDPINDGLPEDCIRIRRSLTLPNLSMFTGKVFFKTTMPATQLSTQGTHVSLIRFSLTVDTYLLGFSIACLQSGRPFRITISADSLNICTADGTLVLEEPVEDRENYLTEGETTTRIASVYDTTQIVKTTFKALQVIRMDAGVIYELKIESSIPNIQWPLVELQTNMSKYGRYMLQHSKAYGLLSMTFLDTD